MGESQDGQRSRVTFGKGNRMGDAVNWQTRWVWQRWVDVGVEEVG